MKKVLSLFLALMMCLFLCACGSSEATETTETTAPIVSREVEALTLGINYIKDLLVDPNSMEIHNVRYTNKPNTSFYYYEIDFSADNNFGGATRETLHIAINIPLDGAEVYIDDISFTKWVELYGHEKAFKHAKENFEKEIATVQIMDDTDIQTAMDLSST